MFNGNVLKGNEVEEKKFLKQAGQRERRGRAKGSGKQRQTKSQKKKKGRKIFNFAQEDGCCFESRQSYFIELLWK